MSGAGRPGRVAAAARAGVGMFALSGAIADTAALATARAYFERRGHRVVLAANVEARAQRFAGADEARRQGFEALLEASELPLLLSARGGYGLTRLLPALDFDRIAAAGKLLVGHSDFTLLQLALLARTGYPTFAGPNAVADFGAAHVDGFTETHFWRTLGSPASEVALPAQGPHVPRVEVEGVLWGGNLALVASLLGTPWFPRVDGGILFLEDVNEHPYRVERLLLQLAHAGVLDRQGAVVLGAFTGYEASPNDAGYDLAAAIERVRAATRTPIVEGLAFGHVRSKATLPVGVTARLDCARDGGALGWSGHPWLDGAAVASAAGRGAAAPTAALRVELGTWAALAPWASAIRHSVFVVEQSVPAEIEIDDLDASSEHALAVDAAGRPVGTGRLLPDGHIGRMAVLAAWRGRGAGGAILRALVARARERGFAEVVLNAQTHALGFYARHGFEAFGESFVEAGIPHRAMRLRLRD